MKQYQSKKKNLAYFLYRLIRPVIDPLSFYEGVKGYIWFVRDIVRFKKLSPKTPLLNGNLFPVLNEKVSYTPFDAHYFYQQLWLFKHIQKRKPTSHIDIASTYQMSGYLSLITKATFVDIRPIKTSLTNLKIKKGDILKLPYKTNSIKSLSCLHVIEHIGLGRYGDPIDPNGTEKACRELVRVLKPGGRLYISTPIGRDRVCFNAHHIHTPETILNYFAPLKLKEFTVVDDLGNFIENTSYKKYKSSDYSCGMFLFTK